MRAVLALEDGRLFRGDSFGAGTPSYGEVVFHTGMTGYQEVISDPSYRGQIVVMTAPLIGNCGVTPDDAESRGLHLAGLVVREYCQTPSSWRSRESLGSMLRRSGVTAVTGVDTRALTRHIRAHGALRGGIGVETDEAELLAAVRNSAPLVGRDLVAEVRGPAPVDWEIRSNSRWRPFRNPHSQPSRGRIAVLDCGVKFGILRNLRDRVDEIRVFPAGTTTERIEAWKPDALLLSNGPGDPAAVESALVTARELLGRLPMMGICLGHQILSLALGARTFKLKFGHHGANHPVQHLRTGKIEITSQNHGFAVDEESLLRAGAEVTRRNLNDGTVEGMQHKELGVVGYQYHPEAAPGPLDASPIFDAFIESVFHRSGNAG
ncbi:MAG: carbamoyl phosphate synthase small subunit [Gemmatimonadetes bacterium]|nr:carbamoyl phosphate synthase small subunit [Gemmatimonadota bacterium]